MKKSCFLAALLGLGLLLAGCGRARAEQAELSFESFDGGGPSYQLVIDDPALVFGEPSRRYHKRNHARLDGAGYTVTFRFTGLQPGSTVVTVEQRSPLGGDQDYLYRATVDGSLRVSLELLEVRNPAEAAALDLVEEPAE